MTLGTRIKHWRNSPNVCHPRSEVEGTVRGGNSRYCKKENSQPKENQQQAQRNITSSVLFASLTNLAASLRTSRTCFAFISVSEDETFVMIFNNI